MKKTIGFGLILAFVLAAPVFAEDAAAKNEVSPPPAALTARQIRPGDTLKINVWKYSDLNASLVVGAEGYVNYSYLGDIPVAGKTVDEVRQLLTSKLNEQYIANPKVDIQLESLPPTIFVVGEVVKPGSYGFQPGLDPVKAIALAGGYTDFASRTAMIIRKDPSTGKEVQIKVNIKQLMKANQDRDQYQLQPGDMVVVKRGWF